MEHDYFDKLLTCEITEDEWQGYAKILNISKFPKNSDDRRLIINKEFRHSYGNTIRNFGRNDFEPDYEDAILQDALKIVKATNEELSKADEYTKPYKPNMVVLYKEDIIYHRIEQSFKEKYNRKFSNNVNDLVNDLLEAVDTYYSAKLTKTKNTFIKGSPFAILAKASSRVLLGGLIIAVTSVNEIFFKANWNKVLPAIMLTYIIRKRLYIMEKLK